MPVIAAQLVLIASLTGLLILLLMGSIALLSIIRQQRHRRAHHAETPISQRDLTVALSMLTPVGTAETLRRPPPSLRALKTRNVIKVDIPEQYRLPIREGDPDEIVIQIDPDPISQDQRNVERLIAFLKSEMDRSNQAS